MATITVTWNVGEFTAGVKDWESFVERVEFFFQANGVEDPERKRALLLRSYGTSTYKLIRNLLVRFMRNMFLLIVDSHSKWIDAHVCPPSHLVLLLTDFEMCRLA